MVPAAPKGGDGVVVVGPHGLIEDVDDGVCDLLGYARTELLGLHGAELIPRGARPRTAVTLDRMRRGELTTHLGTMRRKDGIDVHVEVQSRATSDGRLVLHVKRVTS